MSNQIIKQPNGRWAIFSSVTDSFLVVGGTMSDVVTYYANEAIERTVRDVMDKLARLQAGENVYYQFQMTWDEAVAKFRDGADDAEVLVFEEAINGT